jgi:hypothetical protein
MTLNWIWRLKFKVNIDCVAFSRVYSYLMSV